MAVVKSSTAQLEGFILMLRVRLEREDVKSRSLIMIKIPSDMVAGTIFETNNCGSVKVIQYRDRMNVDVMFIATGTKVVARSFHLRSGSVKDNNYISVLGVGYLGVGEHRAKIKGAMTEKYTAWVNMLRRCYLDEHPTYKDCTVCVEWHDFQVFAEWYENNYPVDGKKYAIDKDIKIDGNKIYSPDFCIFVSQRENNIKASAKCCSMISPSGELVNVYNVSRFCKDNALDRRKFNMVRALAFSNLAKAGKSIIRK